MAVSAGSVVATGTVKLHAVSKTKAKMLARANRDRLITPRKQSCIIIQLAGPDNDR
jgi:hypothetical protein